MNTTDDSAKLWEKYTKYRDRDTRNKLIIIYYPIVHRILRNLQISKTVQMDNDDLISCGVFGLIDAVEKFDLNRCVKFETYAAERIKGSIIDSLRKNDWLPRSTRKKLKLLEKARSDFEVKEGRTPYRNELANMLDMDKNELDDLLKSRNAAYLFSYEALEEKSIYCDHSLDNIYDYMEVKEYTDRILNILSEREKFIISMHYLEDIPLKSISRTLGLTEARISQIHKKALNKLKTSTVDFVTYH